MHASLASGAALREESKSAAKEGLLGFAQGWLRIFFHMPPLLLASRSAAAG